MVLLVIGLLAGLVTGISPCILPVLPIVFAAGTARRPVRIVAGLIVSFSAFTLLGTWLGHYEIVAKNVDVIVVVLVLVSVLPGIISFLAKRRSAATAPSSASAPSSPEGDAPGDNGEHAQP